jgi:hypothetical protein
MRVETGLLAVAAYVLPRRHRARWREEAAAVLVEVSGARRFRYTVDTVVKVPLVAWQHRRSEDVVSVPARVMSAVVGAALLAGAVVVFAPILSGVLRLPPGGLVLGVGDPMGYLLLFGGLSALVAARSFRSARRYGGGLRYADSGAVLITVFVGIGPVIARPLSTGLDLPVVALVGHLLPGAWLAAISVSALRRRMGPWPLAVVGTVAGLALIGVLGVVPLTQPLSGQEQLELLVGRLSLLVAAPTYLVWSCWAGLRLLLGRQDLLLAWPAVPDSPRPGDAR